MVPIDVTPTEMPEEHRDITSPKTKQRFLEAVRAVNPNADLTLISKAYDYSRNAHGNQERKSGEPYFTHLLETSYILLELKPGSSTLAAGLMHDIIEDTGTKPESIKKEFGQDILDLIEGVSKIEKIGRHNTVKIAENQRKVILAMAKDVRIIIIKLADRLHNMRTLKYLPPEKQKRIAQETLDIYAPIAYKLGMYKIKAELEDLCLRYIEPEVYLDLKSKISETREEREKNVEDAIIVITQALKEKTIPAKITGRAKHFHSILTKMRRKNLEFDELHDLLAIRIFCTSIEDCYRVLGIVHEHFRPIPGQMNDYIANPKPNMYQSLHTDVIWRGKPLEIQIRTIDMHYTAEYGVASHWRYKGTDRDKKFDQRLEWLKQILEWQINEKNADHFIENFKIDLFQNEIVVFTPQGDPIVLPEDATPIDFAYEIHTDIGNRCARAKVNNVLVPLDKSLDPGDIIEILTQKNAKPSRSWLQIVKTTKARQKIRQYLNLPMEGDWKKEASAPDTSDHILSYIQQDSKKPLRYSKCCKPQIGDEITGCVMKDGRISVHTPTCMNCKNHAGPIVKLRWRTAQRAPNVQLRIETKDRIGMLSDVLNILASFAIDVRKVRTKKGKENFFIYFDLSLQDPANEQKVITSLEELQDVVRVMSKNV